MSDVIKPEELKALRLSRGLSIKDAADSVGRDYRTWQGYEASSDSESRIKIKPEVLGKFFRAHKIFWPCAKVISVTAYKGGVGKTPITVVVAAAFASKGFKVAVVTNDPVFRSSSESEKAHMKASGKVAGSVDFYDEADIVMYQGETQSIRAVVEKNQQDQYRSVFSDDIERLARKEVSDIEFDNLKKNYDLVFLDINHSLPQTLINSDIIALLVDAACPFSCASSKRYCNKIRELNNGSLGGVHVLLTNFTPIPKLCGLTDKETPELEEMLGLLVWRSEFAVKNYKRLKGLEVPFLRSKFSSEHEYHIDQYDEGRSFDDSFGYFDTVLDIAPDSLAAIEVHDVAEELEGLLWLQG
ncbi:MULTISPECIES: AAA family ATPase [unclassified Pseudomonas]|uniref:AAA family ATPase n=1 Tax=unclassified Pseudomonas TaxID=196821 RepID=UPI000D6BB7F8|nr:MULTISPECIES: AAA family ATPase [unclassified Pseudomonas]PWK45892.1 cellulose biosynthesis protein BcsQ [Pseudomonas sp. OV226]WNZ81623.1 AAA family ATPase [Pseudomonas sp. P108]